MCGYRLGFWYEGWVREGRARVDQEGVTAELLNEIGAKHIVLVSRNGKAKDYAGQNLGHRLSHLFDVRDGTHLSVECCDVSKKGEVKSLIERVQDKHGPINTIVHASGMLQDGLLHNTTAEVVQASFGPKVAGAWYLHKYTVSDDSHHFIVFSSNAAMFGNTGQTNYSASNSYLDSLVRFRRCKGLPAVSIQWLAIC